MTAERPDAAAVVQAGELRSASIESLRAVAALSVLVFHVLWFATGRTAPPGAYDVPVRTLLSGSNGVFLFFALSGYLLTLPFVRAAVGDGAVDLRRYARNRALRILPLYYVALAVLLPLAIDRPESASDWWRFVVFAQNYSDATLFRSDGPMWSLVVEVQFYVLLPLLAAALAAFARADLRRWAWLLVVLGAGSWLLRELTVHAPAYSLLRQRWTVAFPTNFVFFVPGMLLAVLQVSARRRASPRAGSGAIWLALAAAGWGAAVLFWPSRRGFELTALVASFLIVGAVSLARPGRALRWLEWRPLVLLGVASYSLYIWHQPIILGLVRQADLGSSLALDLLVVVPTCVAVAALSYWLCERPLLTLRRRWQAAAAVAAVFAAPALLPPSAAAASGPAPRIAAALRGAPFFTEVIAPRRVARGVVITLHRGAWTASGPGAAATEHPEDSAWRRRGWIAVNSSYSGGAGGLTDVLSVHDRVRRAVGAGLPICLSGASSGGNLALLAAARRRDIACVVARAAPSDLVNIAGQQAYDPSADGGSSSSGPSYLHDTASAQLGAGNLAAFSPIRVARRITARVLLAEAEQDPLVPWQQLTALCTRLAGRCAGAMRLAPGPLQFVHGTVARGALAAYRRREDALASSTIS